jgi:hypothetical protein
MVDMQLLNSALLAVAVLVGFAITFSALVLAVAGLNRRYLARGQAHGGGSGGSRRITPPLPVAPDAPELVLS